jgi:hypothetical protein
VEHVGEREDALRDGEPGGSGGSGGQSGKQHAACMVLALRKAAKTCVRFCRVARSVGDTRARWDKVHT